MLEFRISESQKIASDYKIFADFPAIIFDGGFGSMIRSKVEFKHVLTLIFLYCSVMLFNLFYISFSFQRGRWKKAWIFY
jgi:hypothetical protein